MWVIQSNVARIILCLDIGHPKSMSQQEYFNRYMVGPTICIANGNSRTYSQSVGVRCKPEVVKLMSAG